MNNRPKFPLTLIKADITGQNTQAGAVYIKIVYQDADGKLWKDEHGQFGYLLKEVKDENAA